MICPQPVGCEQLPVSATFVFVGMAVEVGVSVPGKNVAVGTSVSVTVSGNGDGTRTFVGVGAASGTNSTSEIDNAPIIKLIESNATTSALPKSRKLCIISFLLSHYFYQKLPNRRLAATR